MHTRILDYLHEIAIAVPRIGSGSLAAAIVYKGRIISVGVNQMKTHPLQMKYQSNPMRISLHAEIAAIVRGSKLLTESEIRKASVYVSRNKKISGVNSYGLAQPCRGCLDCIMAFGFKDLWHTNNSGSSEPFTHVKL